MEKLSKPLWAFLLTLTGILTLWYGGRAVKDFWSYQRLSTCVPAKIAACEVIPKGSKYGLIATYSYEWKGKKFTRKMFFSKPYHLNRKAAEVGAKHISQMEWEAYVDPKNPGFSSLESRFPLREVFYGVCLVGIFLYFVYLKIHLQLLSKAL